MSNPFQKIWGALHWAGVHVAEGFVKLFGSDAAHAFAHASLEILKSNVGQIVLTAVSGLMNVQGMSGADKKAAAVAQVGADLKAQGLVLGKDVANSEVNLLIETAVSALKNKFMPILTPNADPTPASLPEPGPATPAPAPAAAVPDVAPDPGPPPAQG